MGCDLTDQIHMRLVKTKPDYFGLSTEILVTVSYRVGYGHFISCALTINGDRLCGASV